MSDRSFAEDVAKRSYWHANGFAKLVLRRGSTRVGQQRLHVWNTADGAASLSFGDVNIHNHRWSFKSTVLCGGLRVEEFEIADADRPGVLCCSRFDYLPEPVGKGGRLREVGTAKLRMRRSTTYGASDLHRADTSTLHTVTPIDATLTATFLTQGLVEGPSARVYQLGDLAAVDDPPPMTMQRVVEMAESILEAMAREAG